MQPPTPVASRSPAQAPQQSLWVRGPSGTKEVGSGWQVGRGTLGLANDSRISRKHLVFYVDQTSSGWVVEQLSANPSWVQSEGKESVRLGEKSTHRLTHGDTLWLVAQGENTHSLQIGLHNRPVTQKLLPDTTVAQSPLQSMDTTIAAPVENPLAQGTTVAQETSSAAKPPRQPNTDHLLPGSTVRAEGNELIDDMVIKEVVPNDDGDIRFGEIFFEETRQVRPYLYVPKDVGLKEVLPAMIACFQLKQPSSILDVLPHRGEHDHYLRWSVDVLKDERARQIWRWRDEEDELVVNEHKESHRQQCMRQFGTQLVDAAAEVVKAVNESGGWFCSKAGREASQQLLGHAIEEANSKDYVWLGVACTSRLCWSRQLRKCSRPLKKRDGLGIKPDVKRRVRYPAMRSVFPDNATKFDKDLELSLEQPDRSVATRAQLQWSVIDPHISHLVVFEDPRVEDALRDWAAADGINMDDDLDQAQLHVSQTVHTPGPDSPRSPDSTPAARAVSLCPNSFLRSSTAQPPVSLDYWRHVNPSERNFWRYLRESIQKLDVQVGCLLTNSVEVTWATDCAEEGLPVIVLEAIGAASIEKGIEGDEAAAVIETDATEEDLETEETIGVWTPRKKRGLSKRAAHLRVSIYAKGMGTSAADHSSSISSPRRSASPGRSYRNMAFGAASTGRDFSSSFEGPTQENSEREARGLHWRSPSPSRRSSLPDDAVDDPGQMQVSTKEITIKRGPAGFGFAVNDSCVVTSIAGAAVEAGVSVNSRLIRVAGQNIATKQDIVSQLRLLGRDVSSGKFTFQMPGRNEQGMAPTQPPERPLVTAKNRRRVKLGPRVMARLVRVAVSDPIMYTSLAQREQLREALKVDERRDKKDELKQCAYDKQVVMTAWYAYTTLRYNAAACKKRDEMLQTASQLMHVVVALMACITVSLEIDLEGLKPVPLEDIESETVSVWEPKNSLSGDMDKFWVTWVTHAMNFVGPCVLIAVLGLQAVWSDDVHWAGYLLRAERLRSAIFSYRGRVGEWSLPVIPRGGWWYEQMANARPRMGNEPTNGNLSSVGIKTREQNRERLNELQEDTLAAAMTRCSNTAAQATIPTVIKCGVVLSALGLLLFLVGCFVELKYDDRPLALLLTLCGITGIATGIVVIKPIANQAHKGRSLDMTPLQQPTDAFTQTCAPPYEFNLPWNKNIGISIGEESVPSTAAAGGDNIKIDTVSEEAQSPTNVQATTVTAIDNGFAPISAGEYLQFRAYPLRAELGELGPQLTARLRQLQRLLFLSSLASALCAIAAPVFQRHLATWVCFFNTIGCSALVYSHRTSAREVACAVKTTCITLDACMDWWVTLPAHQKLRPEAFERLVSDVERAVEVLCVVWTSSELELPVPRDKDEVPDSKVPQLLQPRDRDLDAELRAKVQPKGGKLML